MQWLQSSQSWQYSMTSLTSSVIFSIIFSMSKWIQALIAWIASFSTKHLHSDWQSCYDARDAITSKNEVLRVKSLSQHILQEIKESSKFGIYGPLEVFLVLRGMSELDARPFPLKIFYTKISFNSTSGECIYIIFQSW